LQQCNAPPPGHAPPVLGTRERPCSFHRARDQRAGRPSVTNLAGTPHSGPGRWKSGSAGPGLVGLL
jgi:hypothetical protein